MLDKIPYTPFILFAVLMALAPFHPKPHLVEKVQMLFVGELKRGVDLRDLFFHAFPSLLLLLK